MSTTVPISEMSAGREMDGLVAEELLGYEVRHNPYGMYRIPVDEAVRFEVMIGDDDKTWYWKNNGHRDAGGIWINGGRPANGPDGELQPYSTTIGAAWEVMEWLRERSIVVLRTVNDGWQCTTWTEVGQFRNVRHESHGDTAPEAICRCALEVVVGRE